MLGKTTTVLATAVIALAGIFSTNAFAEGEGCDGWDVWGGDCHLSQIDELKDPDQADIESEVADSGNEGSASAAQESDQ